MHWDNRFQLTSPSQAPYIVPSKGRLIGGLRDTPSYEHFQEDFSTCSLCTFRGLWALPPGGTSRAHGSLPVPWLAQPASFHPSSALPFLGSLTRWLIPSLCHSSQISLRSPIPGDLCCSVFPCVGRWGRDLWLLQPLESPSCGLISVHREL